MEMGEIIYRLRKERGMTLEEVGNIVGVGKSTVRKWESGLIANMRRDKIAKIANALGTTPAYLMGWDDDSANIDKIEDNHTSLRDDEEEILIKYNSLNDIGKFEAKKRIDELGMISFYNTSSDYSRQESVITLKAARKKPNAKAEDLEEDFKKLDD